MPRRRRRRLRRPRCRRRCRRRSRTSRADPELEPQVTIIRRETETVEEVRVNGQLRYIRVTPRFGLPYFLVPSGNGQAFQRFDSLGSGLSPPMWLLFSW